VAAAVVVVVVMEYARRRQHQLLTKHVIHVMHRVRRIRLIPLLATGPQSMSSPRAFLFRQPRRDFRDGEQELLPNPPAISPPSNNHRSTRRSACACAHRSQNNDPAPKELHACLKRSHSLALGAERVHRLKLCSFHPMGHTRHVVLHLRQGVLPSRAFRFALACTHATV